MKKLLLFLLLIPFASAQTNSSRMLSGVNYVDISSYQFSPLDVTRPTVFRASGTVVATLPAGTNLFFGAGSIFTVIMQGSGTLIINCSGCTIAAGGTVGATLTLTTGQGADIYGDGLNYSANIGAGSGGGGGGSSAWASLISGNNNSGTFSIDTGASLFPINNGLIRSNSFVPSTFTQAAPGTVDFTGCSSQTPALKPFAYAPLANSHFAEWMCMDEAIVSPPASPAGTPEFTFRTWYNGTGIAMPGMKNRFMGIAWYPGLGGVSSAGGTLQTSALGVVTETAGTDTSFSQLLTSYMEMQLDGAPTFTGTAGGEDSAATGRFNFTDNRTGGTAIGKFAALHGIMFLNSATLPVGSCGNGNCWIGVQGSVYDLMGGSRSSAIYEAIRADGSNSGGCTNCGFIGLHSTFPTVRFASINYGLNIDSFGTNSSDFNIVSAGVNSAGTAAGFNALVGPTKLGLQQHAASGFQLDVLGSVRLQAAAGAALLDLFGSTSGHAQIGAAAAAGTPNMMLLPTSTGANGTCLSTDGGSPQQLTWIVCGGGGGGSGITTLNGLTPLIQTFAVNNAGSNVALSINSVTATHTFSAALTGTIPAGNLPTTTPQSCTPTGIPLTCSIIGQVLNLGIGVGSTWGATSLNANVVQSVSAGTNIAATILNQVLSVGLTGAVTVPNGGTGNSSITTNQIFVGTASNTLTAKTLPNGILSFNNSTQTFSAASALTNPMTTDCDLITQSSAVPARIGCPTSPDGVTYVLTSKSTGGVGGIPVWALPGIAGRQISGASDTVVATDRSGWIIYNGSSATAIGLGSAAGFGSNFVFGVGVTGTVGGTGATLTATTSKFQPENTSTFVVYQGDNCSFSSLDNVDYWHRCSPGQIFVGADHITLTRSSLGVTLDGDPNTVTAASNLTANALVLGNGSKAATVLGSLGTTTTVLHGNAAGAPSFGAVALATDISGTLPIANNCPGATGASSSTFLRGDCTWATPAGGGSFNGPGSSVAHDIISFANTSGSLGEDSGVLATQLVTAASAFTSGNLVKAAASNRTTSDSGIAAANVVLATSPGLGIAHFSGSTQSLTSSLIVAADITSATITGTQIASSIALAGSPTTTTQTCGDSSTKLATTAFVMCPISLTAGTSVTLSGPSQYFVCTTTCTITVPVPAAGNQYCVYNDNNINTVITLSAIGSSARYENTARSAYGTAGTGTFISGGAVGDKVCIVGRDSTHYSTISFNGTWTAN